MTSASSPGPDAFARVVGREVDVGEVFERLTARGWKIDTEESNLLHGFSRTFMAAGIKVWVFLDEFACAPPRSEAGTIADIQFHRFAAETMPRTSMCEQLLAAFADDDPPPPSWFEEWQWLIDHGDPQFDTFDRLEPIAVEAVPPQVRAACWAELSAALGSA